MKAIFKWAAAESMVPAGVYHALACVAGLKRGRCPGVRESERVRPVPDEHIAAIREYVSRQVWALVQLQLLSAARPGELVGMRAVDINAGGKVWTYVPTTHKTEHHGHGRTIYFGPQAQEIIRPYLAGRPVDAPLFSAAEADAERRERLTAARTTPASCGNGVGTNRKRKPKRAPGDQYDVDTYRRAIQRGCELAKVPSWHPHALRHSAGTKLRREHGLDVCQTILGHRIGSGITELYCESNTLKAIDVMAKVG